MSSKFNDPPTHHCSGFPSFHQRDARGFIRDYSGFRQDALEALPNEMHFGGLPVTFYKPECGTAIVIQLGSKEVTLTGEQVKEFWRQIEKLAHE